MNKNNTGEENSGDRNSGYGNSGDRNSGDGNSGDGNSGIFNIDEPKMRAFNKECDMTYTEFREKFGYEDLDLPICSWTDKENMTDEEKENISGWETMGGYLKTLSYKEAWKKAWNEATQEQKDWYKSFPNFDAKIFEEITGIDIEETFKSGEVIEICKNGKKIKCKVC